MSVSVLVTSLSMKVLVFATRNRNLFCQRKICEFEKLRAIQGLRMEMDFKGR